MILAAPALTITQQPADFTGAVGDTAAFTVAAVGDGLTCQWQVDTGAGWKNATSSGNKTATMRVGVTEARLAYRYRCVVTDATGGSLTSNAAWMVLAG